MVVSLGRETRPLDAEVRMEQTQNTQEDPVNPDAACVPTFECEEIAQYYGDGLMERPAADVFDVLYSTGFAQEECTMSSRATICSAIRRADWCKRVSRLVWHLLVMYEAMEEKPDE